ncbi:hypothetical protein C7S16_7121 [Burkholderia thailandensis]|uniref:Uncharacterized protein n=1 Tax=Burkholderia thailandensis TaxID=57975 RepID=A0AAW9CSF4_BURTH|nr:hypothetical protein [Burkholderia thailandensis]MDW9251569.1 hypothetical protein [Burkholderia thailandensis]
MTPSADERTIGDCPADAHPIAIAQSSSPNRHRPIDHGSTDSRAFGDCPHDARGVGARPTFGHPTDGRRAEGPPPGHAAASRPAPRPPVE